jgi:hypothetical protein
MAEALDEFIRSFSYGTRTDLNFKFLARTGEEDAGEVIRRILEEVGQLLDHGDPGPLMDLLIAAQAAGYSERRLDDRYRYDDAPFHAPEKPVAESRLALLTSSGHFAEGDDPQPFGVEAMTQEEAVRRIGDFLKAAPQLSAVPVDAPVERTVVRHGGYDVHGSEADRNVTFPIDVLRHLAEAGVIGDLHHEAYSFVGAAAQTRIRKESAPTWAALLREHDVDVALLVPV